MMNPIVYDKSSSDDDLSASESSTLCSEGDDVSSLDSTVASRSSSPYIANDDLAASFSRLSLSSSNPGSLKGIIYTMDSENRRAMVRVMCEQDECHAVYLPSSNYRIVDLQHLYIPYHSIKGADKEIEIGSVIEIMEYEGGKLLTGISEAYKHCSKKAARILKYSVVPSPNNRLATELVAITRIEDHCLKVVGSEFGSIESIVAFPRKSKPAEWKSMEHTFIYGELIHLPKFFKVIRNNGEPELTFDHESRLCSIKQYEEAIKTSTTTRAFNSGHTVAMTGRPFLQRIRKLTKLEEKTILLQTRNLDGVTIDLAIQFVRDPLLTCAALEEYVARESVRQFTCAVSNISFELDKKFSPAKDVIYVPITPRVTKCLTVRGRDTWHLGSDLVLSNKDFLGRITIPVIIDRTSVQRGTGKYIRLVGGAGSEHILDAIKKHNKNGNINWFKLTFQLGPMDEDSNTNAEAIKDGFEKFFDGRFHLYEAFVGRSSAPNLKNIPRLNEDYSIGGQKLDKSQRIAMRTALGHPGFTCVSAPPGSGKTFMISGLVAAKLKEQPHTRFAISATTNIAVTNAIETVHSKFPKEKKVRQFSRKAEAELGKNSAVLDISLKKLTRNPDIVSKLLSHEEFADAVAGRDAAQEMMKHQASTIVEQLRYVEDYRKAESNVGVKFIKYYAPKIYGTTGSIMARSDHEGITHLIVDESAQMSQIDALSLYCRLPHLQYITLVGDSRQLGPFTDLQVGSLAHKIINVGELTRLEKLQSSAKRELQFIYRCHPRMIDLLLKPIYGKELQSGTPADQRSLAIDKDLPRAADGSPCLFVQVNGREQSGRNKKEVEVVLAFLDVLKAKGIKPEEVNIICHHRAQKDSICHAIKDKGSIGRLNLMYGVNTVDSYQGKEAKVILILTTKTCENSKPEVAERTFSFISDANRETVAVSRAQHAIYLFGNWSQVAVMPFWNQFGDGLIKSGAFVDENWKPMTDPGWKTKPRRKVLEKNEKSPKNPVKGRKIMGNSPKKPANPRNGPKLLGKAQKLPEKAVDATKDKKKRKRAARRKAHDVKQLRNKVKETDRDDVVNEKIVQPNVRLKSDQELAAQCEKKLVELNFNIDPDLDKTSRKTINDTKGKLQEKCEAVEKELDKTVFSINKDLKDFHEHMQKVYDYHAEGDKDVIEIKKALECMRIQQQSTISWLLERLRNFLMYPFQSGGDSAKFSVKDD